jgi:hypothetical protein
MDKTPFGLLPSSNYSMRKTPHCVHPLPEIIIDVCP